MSTVVQADALFRAEGEAIVRFTVSEKPQPGGSKKAFAIPVGKPLSPGGRFRRGTVAVADKFGQLRFGRINVSDANKNVKPWQKKVAAAALSALPEGFELLTGPLEVTFTFYRARPKAHFGTGSNAAVLKGSAPAKPITRPDALKLARAVEDALSGVVWVDDSQIVDEHLYKRYGPEDCCEVEVRHG